MFLWRLRVLSIRDLVNATAADNIPNITITRATAAIDADFNVTFLGQAPLPRRPGMSSPPLVSPTIVI